MEDGDNTRQLAELIRRLPGPALLCGDLNLPDIDWRQLSAPAGVQQQVLEAVQDRFWSQVVDFPTHKGGNLIDLGISSSQGLVAKVDTLGYLASADHQMLKFTIVGPRRNNTSTEDEIGKMNWEMAFQG